MFGRKKLMLKLNNVILLLEWARVIPSVRGSVEDSKLAV